MNTNLNNVTEVLHILIKDWKKNGFNGIQFADLYVEEQLLEDWLSDGRTKEDYLKWRHNNVAFIASPIIPFFDDDNNYITQEFNESVFWKDFKSTIINAIDGNIKITRLYDEFEISRRN